MSGIGHDAREMGLQPRVLEHQPYVLSVGVRHNH